MIKGKVNTRDKHYKAQNLPSTQITTQVSDFILNGLIAPHWPASYKQASTQNNCWYRNTTSHLRNASKGIRNFVHVCVHTCVPYACTRVCKTVLCLLYFRFYVYVLLSCKPQLLILVLETLIQKCLRLLIVVIC